MEINCFVHFTHFTHFTEINVWAFSLTIKWGFSTETPIRCRCFWDWTAEILDPPLWLFIAVCKDSYVIFNSGSDRNGKWSGFCESRNVIKLTRKEFYTRPMNVRHFRDHLLPDQLPGELTGPKYILCSISSNNYLHIHTHTHSWLVGVSGVNTGYRFFLMRRYYIFIGSFKHVGLDLKYFINILKSKMFPNC